MRQYNNLNIAASGFWCSRMKVAKDAVIYKVQGGPIYSGSWKYVSMQGAGRQCVFWVLEKQSPCRVLGKQYLYKELGCGHVRVKRSSIHAGCWPFDA